MHNHTKDLKRYFGKIAVGSIKNYRDSLYLKDSTTRRKLLGFLISEIKKAADDIYDMYSVYSAVVSNWIYSDYKPLFIFSTETYRESLKKYVLEDGLNLEDAMYESLQDFLDFCEDHRYYPKNQKDLEHVYDTYDYMKSAARNAYVILFYSRIKKKPTIVVTDKFSWSFFYKTPKNIKGFIFKNKVDKHEPFACANELDYTIAFSDDEYEDGQKIIINPVSKSIIYKPTNAEYQDTRRLRIQMSDMISEQNDLSQSIYKIYAMNPKMADIDKIAKLDAYRGICVLKSEFKYLSYGRVPELDSFYKDFYEILTKMDHKETIFQLPYFQEKLTISSKKNKSYIESFMTEYHIYLPWIEALAKASHKLDKEINLAIPGIRNKGEYQMTFLFIKSIFVSMGAPVPKFGYLMNTIEMFRSFEDHTEADFTVISLDEILEASNEFMNRYETEYKARAVMKLIGDHIISVHQFYRKLNVNQRHIVMGRCLANKDIFHTFRVKGFREFAIPTGNLHIVVPYLNTVIRNKGRYVGVHESNKLRKKLKLTNQENNDIDDTKGDSKKNHNKN